MAGDREDTLDTYEICPWGSPASVSARWSASFRPTNRRRCRRTTNSPYRQAGPRAERPRQGHRRRALHGRRPSARHALRRIVRSPHAARARSAPSTAPPAPSAFAPSCSSRGRTSRERRCVRYIGAPVAAVAAVIHGSGRGGAAPGPRRLRAAALRRGHGGARTPAPAVPDGPRHRRAPGGWPAPAGVPQRAMCAGPARQPRRCGAGLRRRRGHRRSEYRTQVQTHSPGDARHRRRLAAGRPYRLRVDAGHRRGARRAGGGFRPADGAGSRRRRAWAAASARNRARQLRPLAVRCRRRPVRRCA